MKREARVLILVFGLVLTWSAIFLTESPAYAKEKKITLKMVYQQPWTDSHHVFFKKWHDKVNAAAPDRPQRQRRRRRLKKPHRRRPTSPRRSCERSVASSSSFVESSRGWRKRSRDCGTERTRKSPPKRAR